VASVSLWDQSKLGICCMANLLNSSSASNTEFKTLLLAHKTELVRELTRAMANQFNNTMMAVTSYAELEMKRLPPAQRRSLEQVLDNAARATALVQKLLGISRNEPGAPRPLNLNSVLTEIKLFIDQLTGERLSLVYELDAKIPLVNVDPIEIEQLVLSLAVNARNMTAKGGTLTILTKSALLTSDMIGDTERPGEYVLLSVADSDAPEQGAQAEQHAKSADQDARMNMSLAVMRAVAKSVDGIARVSREPGKGCSFNIYFPALHQDAKTEEERTIPRKVAVARTILIVEDDDAVRVPTSELLKMEGFKVLQARSGEEAISIIQQNKPTLDVLITDVVMPRMGGHEVAAKLLEVYSGLKVLYMSGDTHGSLSSQNTGRTPGATLRKPFRLEVLKDKIHELLGE
jgi:two-component system cell cycle sensor histidine kinase/response regulator CckA